MIWYIFSLSRVGNNKELSLDLDGGKSIETQIVDECSKLLKLIFVYFQKQGVFIQGKKLIGEIFTFFVSLIIGLFLVSGKIFQSYGEIKFESEEIEHDCCVEKVTEEEKEKSLKQREQMHRHYLVPHNNRISGRMTSANTQFDVDEKWVDNRYDDDGKEEECNGNDIDDRETVILSDDDDDDDW